MKENQSKHRLGRARTMTEAASSSVKTVKSSTRVASAITENKSRAAFLWSLLQYSRPQETH